MEMEVSVVLDLWELIAENVPGGRKDEVATKFVSIFANQGLEHSHFNSISGEDDHLDNAVAHFFGEDDEDDYGSYNEDYDD